MANGSIATAANRYELGQLLKRLREGVGLTAIDAARRAKCDKDTIWRYERGESKISFPMMVVLMEAYKVRDDDLRRQLLELQEQAGQPLWWSEFSMVDTRYVAFESIAESIDIFEGAFIPGPLQTEPVVRAVMEGLFREESEDEIERKVQLRLERQARNFMIPDPPVLNVVLDEAVLWHEFGGPKVMAEQLRYLAGLNKLIQIRVVPKSVPVHPGRVGPLWIFTFKNNVRPPAAYSEGVLKNLYVDDGATLANVRKDFKVISDLALSPEDSHGLLLRIAEEMERK